MNKEKNQKNAGHAQAKTEQGMDLSKVPSISDFDTLTPTEPLAEFPFAENEDTEPEAVLDIPSFLGLDMLDITAAAKLADDLGEDQDHLPEVPVFSSDPVNGKQADLPEIPSFADDTDFKDDTITDLPIFDPSEETIPAIPSFLDSETTDAESKAMEDLPEISSFFSFGGEEKKNQTPVSDIPEQVEFHGDLTEAEEDILPRVPSILDLNENEMNLMLSMPVSETIETSLFDEEADYLLEVPSVTDCEEEEEEKQGQSDDQDEADELMPEPVIEEMLAEEDILPVTELPLSVKAKNGLLRSNIRDSKQLMQARDDRLIHIPHMDQKTLFEIQRYRNEHHKKDYPEPKAVPREVMNWLHEFLEELKEIGVPEQKHQVLKLYLCAVHQETNKTKEACYAEWYQEQHILQYLDQKITALFRNRQMSGLSVAMLQEDLPVSLSKKILVSIIDDMIKTDRIHQARDNYYILKYPTVLEFLSENTEEKEQHIDVIRQRMNGRSLEEIAISYGASKEHVSRIQNHLLRLVQKLCLINSTSVYEERFRPLFERYNLSKEIFTALTKDSEQVYQYLSMVSVAGSAKPEEMKFDFGVPDWIRAAWKELQKQMS